MWRSNEICGAVPPNVKGPGEQDELRQAVPPQDEAASGEMEARSLLSTMEEDLASVAGSSVSAPSQPGVPQEVAHVGLPADATTIAGNTPLASPLPAEQYQDCSAAPDKQYQVLSPPTSPFAAHACSMDYTSAPARQPSHASPQSTSPFALPSRSPAQSSSELPSMGAAPSAQHAAPKGVKVKGELGPRSSAEVAECDVHSAVAGMGASGVGRPSEGHGQELPVRLEAGSRTEARPIIGQPPGGGSSRARAARYRDAFESGPRSGDVAVSLGNPEEPANWYRNTQVRCHSLSNKPILPSSVSSSSLACLPEL
jgi:hypothetical protein